MVALMPFRRGVRPADAASLPIYLDRTFDDVGHKTQQIVEAFKALEARVAALEAQP